MPMAKALWHALGLVIAACGLALTADTTRTGKGSDPSFAGNPEK